MQITSKTAKGAEFTLTLKGTRLFLTVPAAKIIEKSAMRANVRGVDCIECPAAKIATPVTAEIEPILIAQAEAKKTEKAQWKLEQKAQDAKVRSENEIIFVLVRSSEQFCFDYNLIEGYVNKSGSFTQLAFKGTFKSEVAEGFATEKIAGSLSQTWYQVSEAQINEMLEAGVQFETNKKAEAEAREVAQIAEGEAKKVAASEALQSLKAEAAKTGKDVAWGAPFTVADGKGEEGVIVSQRYVRADGTTYSKEFATY